MRFRGAGGVLGVCWASRAMGGPKRGSWAKSGAQRARRACGPRGSSARADKARNEVHRAGAGARERQGRAGQRTETRAEVGIRAEVISELRLLLKVTMADQSEITLGVGVAPMVVEHEGGRRKGRGKSRDPSRAREDLGDLEKRLAKVELHLVDGEERFEEVDTRLMELDERTEELRGDMQGALNAAFDKLASEGESLRLSQMGEIAALRDENRSLKEQLEWAMGKLKEVEQQVSLVAMAVARGGVATTSGASLVIPSRVEVPKPSMYSGARNAKEIDNFLWSLEQYFRAIGITDDAKKVDHAPLYLVDTAMVWWRRRHGDMEKGLCTIASWDEFKRELKRQFYPENAAHEARARLRRLSHRGSIRDYVKEFMETLLEIPDYPDAEALFAFTDGLQTWARLEIERRGALDLATAISIAESLVEFQRSERSRSSPQKDRSEGGDSRGKDGSSKPKEVQPRSQGKTEKSKLSALVEEREERPFQPREATMGSLQLSALKVQEKGTVNVEKGRPFVQIEVGGQKLRALLDTGASHNFLTVEEAKRLGIPYEREMGWLKAVNSTPNLIHGVARDTKVRIGDWRGTLDFFIVSMDDSPCILGVEFVDRAKAIPMLFANSMCITEGGGTCVVPLLRGKASNTLATMHVEMHDPSLAAQGEKQHGKGGGTPKKDLKECKRGHTPKLQKGPPPREKVDCARGNAVARSPREESPSRQEGPRRHRSRKSRRKCKAEGRAGALSHRDEGGTAGAQREKARSNTAVHAGRHGRRSKRRGRRAD
ncbi:hypothetical protein GH714_012837 [Hevea brasiliensis]|uniref:Retrotransposon gag domain-containing protein n=1 Tax=Hevea brasiliensis TaxID=3981 RepID=A0A6A6MN04_HEVBR|nr:hypothetical protein GH714_012837 [Hevea brasiliensis]